MYGLPGRPLTEEEEFLLDLCMPRAILRKAQVAVLASRIAAGALPPPEWFELDEDDPAVARNHYQVSLLRSKIREHG